MPGYRFAFFETNDVEATKLAASMLEEGRTYPIDKRWSVRVDRSHANSEMTHNHVQLKNRDVAIINYDGTPSHNSDLSKIPSWIRDWMRDEGLTEHYLVSEENKSLGGVPAGVVSYAVGHEVTMTKAGDLISRYQRD